MACYYIVISSTHLSNGHFRNIKGVFRGPLCRNSNKNLDYGEKEKSLAKALEDLKANFYCQLCDKQYYKHQEFDNHINSYDHAHKQRLKELKQREFARNVASKLRKDERKQERALRRLHKLAEQRREVQCAPGSGPMFKSTTVAVESFSKSCLMEHEENQNMIEKDAGSQLLWPYREKSKKQTFRRKIAFSFSFPKKTSLKLEASAAVFCESAEEKKLMKYHDDVDDALLQPQSSPKSSLKDRIPASDMCAFLVYSEDTSLSPITHFQTEKGSDPNIDPNSEERNITEQKDESSQEWTHNSITDPPVEPTHDISLDVSPSIDNSCETQEQANPCSTKPGPPFFSVLGRDDKTIFQWPSEMVSFTRTEPSISFSCNPLHFDFRRSQIRQSPDVQATAESKTDKESFIISENSPQKTPCCERSTGETTYRPEKKPRKYHLYSSSTESSCERQKSPSRCRGLNNCSLVSPAGKRVEDKLQARYRHHSRNRHKKKHRRRSRREENRSKPERSENVKKGTKFHRRDSSREGFESQFKGFTSQQAQPLEKSKPLSQNQAANNSITSSAGGINGSVEACNHRGKVADNTEEMPDIPLAEETTIIGCDSDRLNKTPSDSETSAADQISRGTTILEDEQAKLNLHRDQDSRSDLSQHVNFECLPCPKQPGSSQTQHHNNDNPDVPVSEASVSDQSSKRLAIPIDEDPQPLEEAPKKRPNVSLHDTDDPLAYQCIYCEEIKTKQDTEENSFCPEHGQKRKKLDLSETPHHGHQNPDQGPEDKVIETTSAEPTGDTLDLQGKSDSSKIDASNPVSCSVNEKDSTSVDFPLLNTISGKACQASADNSRLQMILPPAQRKDSHRAKPSGDPQPPEIQTDTKQIGTTLIVESRAEQGSDKDWKSSRKIKEKTSHDKSCQHSPQLPSFHLLDKERLSLEGFCSIQSPFNTTLCFASQLDGVECHDLLYSHARRQIMHPKVFPTRLKPVLARSTIPVSSPILHRVHLPSAVPSSSIRILQHHATFLAAQQSLFPQVVPVTRLPLGPEIAPYVTSSQVSMVAPPAVHPTAVTFHALPRPQVFRPVLHHPAPFPPLLPPHATVIPLQPLF
ncbi:zinc finger protein 804A [Trichomycterus rosablanca]|uniref:zinc finger protein 804A n=1 Tax=Trichomycterus rosablanca TaxID=2290929 RepID=UPI002F357188